MTKPPKPSRIIGTGVLVAGSAKVEATARVFRRLPPDHPVHNLVGRVANEWAFVEHLLDEIIWHLDGLDAPTGACLTAQIVGSWSRMLTITALCTHRGVGQPVLNQISDVARQLHGPKSHPSRSVVFGGWVAANSAIEGHAKGRTRHRISGGDRRLSQ